MKLSFLNRGFHDLSFDVSHDNTKKCNILWWLPPFAPPVGAECPQLKQSYRLWKYKHKALSMPIFSFIAHSVWTCPLSTRYSSLKAIFRSFPAADGQIGGHMDIIFAFLNKIFHYLSFVISHDHKKMENILGWVPPFTPPWWGGGQSAPPQKIFWILKI